MIGGSRIIDFHSGRDGNVPESVLPVEPAPVIEEPIDPPPTPLSARIGVGVAIVAGIAWIAFAAWVLLRQQTPIALMPVAIVQLAAALIAPPLLVAILWFVARRTGDAETRRFAAVQGTMRAEAASFEGRMRALSEQIAADRVLLEDHVREMLNAGDGATARMQAVSNAVTSEVASIHAAARTLGESTDTAGKRLAILLAQLPKAQGEVETLAERLDSIGMGTGERVSALDAQLSALAERGRHADEVAGGAAQRLAAHISRMEATSESASARLEEVAERMSGEVDAVLDQAARAIDEARRGIAAQGEATNAMLASNQAALDEGARAGLESLRERIAQVEESIGRIGASLAREQAQVGGLFETLDAHVLRASDQLDMLHEAGSSRTQVLASEIATLTSGLEAMREAMTSGDAVAQATIHSAEGLLTALDAATREIDETLPEALSRLDIRVGDSRSIVGAAKPELLALVNAAESTHDAIEAINDTVNNQRESLIQLSTRLSEALETGSERVVGIRSTVERTITETRDFAEDTAPRLVEALVRIRESANVAADHARAALNNVIPQAAERLENEAAGRLAHALDESVTRQLTRLGEAADQAATAAAHAADRVSEQTRVLIESGALIDQRFEKAEVAEQESFARRTATLIDALNSASIDISKALSADVADTAWAAYLKGDRGVFTRRAVRLIEPGQLGDIADLYDVNDGFRDQVNRYIHDFEAMLRLVLTQRDGSPMGITLLSSDSGKLYVALAQAIDRLRT